MVLLTGDAGASIPDLQTGGGSDLPWEQGFAHTTGLRPVPLSTMPAKYTRSSGRGAGIRKVREPAPYLPNTFSRPFSVAWSSGVTLRKTIPE